MKGLPDFSQQVEGENYIAFAPYEWEGNVTAIPLSLEIAKNKEGKLAFTLEFLRRRSSFGEPKPYGMLQFSLNNSPITEFMTNAIREEWPRYPIERPLFFQGFMRLIPTFDLLEEDRAVLQEPIALNDMVIAQIRFARKISSDVASGLKKALQHQTMLVNAFAECTLKGVAPRIPIKTEFNPAKLIKSLERFTGKVAVFSVAEITEFFEQEKNRLPFSNYEETESVDTKLFAATMTDWVIDRFGKYVPAPIEKLEPHVELPTSDDVENGVFKWDLSTPLIVSRMLTFEFNAFEAAQNLVGLKDIKEVYKETIINRLPSGFIRIVIDHQLSQLPENVREAGIKIHVPSSRNRPRAINKTIEFKAEEYREELDLKFSTREEPVYFYTPYVIVKNSFRTEELEGERTQSSAQHLKINLAEFPIDFIPITASNGLLNKATIEGRCNWEIENKKEEVSFEINQENPSIFLALPKNTARQAEYAIEAKQIGTDKSVSTTILGSSAIRLNELRFKEFGSQKVVINCEFGNQNGLFALELLPEGKAATPENSTVLSFKPAQAQRTWTWFAHSMFEPGFQYREFTSDNSKEWSTIQSPFIEELTIELGEDGTGIIAAPEKEVMMKVPRFEGDKEFEDVIYFQNPFDEHAFYFIPLIPSIKTDNRDKAMFSLIIVGETSMLQLTTEWRAKDENLEGLRTRLSIRHPDLTSALLRLSFAPIEIESANLVLQEGEEDIILSSSKTSGVAPFAAIFNAQLTKEQKEKVIAALKGEAGIFKFNYKATRNFSAKIFLEIKGDIESVTRDLSGEASLEDCHNWVKESMDKELLILTKKVDEQIDKQNQTSAEKEAIEIAANYVLKYIQENPSFQETNLLIELEKEQIIQQPFIVTFDIAHWFEHVDPEQHIQSF